MPRHFLALATLAIASVLPVPASTYPNKPIRMVVPYAAGGNADITARLVAQKMSEHLGQPIIVENKADANGGIGTGFVAKSAPDGYTLLMVASDLVRARKRGSFEIHQVDVERAVPQLTRQRAARCVRSTASLQAFHASLRLPSAMPSRIASHATRSAAAASSYSSVSTATSSSASRGAG